MAGCNKVFIEVDYPDVLELNRDIQRFAFDDSHLQLRENLAKYTINGSNERLMLEKIHGGGIHGASRDEKLVGRKGVVTARYVQAATVSDGEVRGFLAAVQELSDFHESNRLQPVTVWSLRF